MPICLCFPIYETYKTSASAFEVLPGFRQSQSETNGCSNLSPGGWVGVEFPPSMVEIRGTSFARYVTGAPASRRHAPDQCGRRGAPRHHTRHLHVARPLRHHLRAMGGRLQPCHLGWEAQGLQRRKQFSLSRTALSVWMFDWEHSGGWTDQHGIIRTTLSGASGPQDADLQSMFGGLGMLVMILCPHTAQAG